MTFRNHLPASYASTSLKTTQKFNADGRVRPHTIRPIDRERYASLISGGLVDLTAMLSDIADANRYAAVDTCKQWPLADPDEQFKRLYEGKWADPGEPPRELTPFQIAIKEIK